MPVLPAGDIRWVRRGVGGWREKESEKERGGQQKDALGSLPVLLVKLQHHVVRGDA